MRFFRASPQSASLTHLAVRLIPLCRDKAAVRGITLTSFSHSIPIIANLSSPDPSVSRTLEGWATPMWGERRGAGPKGEKCRSRRQRRRLRSACDAELPQSLGGPVFEDLDGVRFRRKEALNAHLLHGHILRRTKGGNGGEQAKGRLTLIINRGNPLRVVVILAGSGQCYS
jgi:hypothetical protein